MLKRRYLKTVTIDSSYKCTLECPRCRRQSYREDGIPPGGKYGSDITIHNFKKLLNFFQYFNFCGQVSDSIFNPDFCDKTIKLGPKASKLSCYQELHCKLPFIFTYIFVDESC